MERRIQVGTQELRASKRDGKKRVSGYAARYGVLSSFIAPGVKERIARGAFRRILSTKPNTVLTFNHNENYILGRTTAGTLNLREDGDGLLFDAELPDTTV